MAIEVEDRTATIAEVAVDVPIDPTEVAYRETLDAAVAGLDATAAAMAARCNGKGEAVLVISCWACSHKHGHIAPTFAEYRDGVLRAVCAYCRVVVARVAVARTP